jgi:hypothetical protein
MRILVAELELEIYLKIPLHSPLYRNDRRYRYQDVQGQVVARQGRHFEMNG